MLTQIGPGPEPGMGPAGKLEVHVLAKESQQRKRELPTRQFCATCYQFGFVRTVFLRRTVAELLRISSPRCRFLHLGTGRRCDLVKIVHEELPLFVQGQLCSSIWKSVPAGQFRARPVPKFNSIEQLLVCGCGTPSSNPPF